MTRRRGGPTARTAIDPVSFIAFLDTHAVILTGGSPLRTRRLLNGISVDQSTDGRVIRRWRAGSVEGITERAAEALLNRYRLTLNHFTIWTAENGYRAYIRNNEQGVIN